MRNEIQHRYREWRELREVQDRINALSYIERADGVREETKAFLSLHNEYYALSAAHDEARAQRRIERIYRADDYYF